ncbi:MAG: ribonuclease J [Actinobacteria bacterium]|nr:ribonuclease J [Actinomycetota bacterium]
MPKKSSLKLIPLGGLDEVGKNMMILEKDNQILIIDCGVVFPDDEMLGIDFVIPDFTYIRKNIDKIKAIILTHGHEDHIGAVPFLLKEVNVPIYATKLTLGLVRVKLDEFQVYTSVELNEIDPDRSLSIGPFDISFFRVSHSIPDGVGLIIRTDIGTIVHSGDFKFDQSPVDGKITEYSKIGEAGKEGVFALLCDSTNAEEPGYTLPERDVGKTLLEKFEEAKKRIIVATFSSHIHRIQQVMDVSHKLGKKVAISGKSILKTIKVAEELGYLKIPRNTIIPITRIDEYPLREIVILSTGSQGEPLSALHKMALNEHKRVQIMKGDTVIISASPIPGNEKAISNTINMLIKQGADVFYESIAGVHVSGHAAQEEIKMMINLVRPRYFIPIHGENKHKIQNAKLAQLLGIKEENIIIARNGDIIKMNENVCRISSNLNPKTIYIDGIGSGDMEDIVIKDRKLLSRDGIMVVVVGINEEKKKIVCEPDFIFKGIIYIDEFDSILEACKELVIDSIDKCFASNITASGIHERYIKDRLEKFVYKKIRIKPVIITKVMNV